MACSFSFHFLKGNLDLSMEEAWEEGGNPNPPLSALVFHQLTCPSTLRSNIQDPGFGFLLTQTQRQLR